MVAKSVQSDGWPQRLLVILTAPLIVMIVTLLLPVVAIVLLYWLLAAALLNVLWWVVWCTRGKDILFVYSISPNWHDYIEREIIPQIMERAIILNWSHRRHWLRRLSLPSLVFRHFGGAKEYNSMAIHFRPFRCHRSFRFWQAFRDRKHGNCTTLAQLESEFFQRIELKTWSDKWFDEEPIKK
jgi:hypothetical protein